MTGNGTPMTDPGTTDGTTQTEGQTARDIFPEDDGIPEVAQDDSPTLQRAEDPQFQALPGESPTAATDFGTTAAEQAEGEPLDSRLSREEPDVLAAVDLPADESEGADTPFDERAGQGVGRLVEADEGARTDTEADLVAGDVGTDLGGYSAEESAMHIEHEV